MFKEFIAFFPVVMSDPKSRTGDEDKRDITKMYVCIVYTSFISI